MINKCTLLSNKQFRNNLMSQSQHDGVATYTTHGKLVILMTIKCSKAASTVRVILITEAKYRQI